MEKHSTTKMPPSVEKYWLPWKEIGTRLGSNECLRKHLCAEVFKVNSIIQVPNQLGPQHFAGAKIKSLMLFLAPLFMPLYDFFLFV